MNRNEISELINQMRKSQAIAKLVIANSNMIKQAQEMAAAINRQYSIQSIFENNSELMRACKTVADNQQQFKKILGEFRKLDIAGEFELFCMAMFELGWPPPMHLDWPAIRKVVRLYKSNDIVQLKDWIEPYLWDIYDDVALESMLCNWKQKLFLKGRIHILRDIIEVHKSGNYTLSIPALLPQIEGVVADCYAHRHRMNGKKFMSYIENITEECQRASISSHTNHWFKQFLADILLAQFAHGDPLSNGLSRHAILHGANTNYATAANSLKSIILFDYLVDLFKFASTKKGKCYHLVGCNTICSCATMEFFDSHHMLEVSGKSPCKICKPDIFASRFR
jgi:hypothetical protein